MPTSGTLYGSPYSTCSRRVLMTATEAGGDWKYVPIDLAKGEQKSEKMLEIQPYGKVPAWREESGFSLFESRAITSYLAAGTTLIPDSPTERALMEQWISVEHSYFAPSFLPIYYMKALKKAPLDEAKVAEHTAALGPTLDLLDKRLAEPNVDYLAGGGDFTLADLTYMPYLCRWADCGLAETLDSRPALKAWWEKISERPAWKYVMAQGFMERKVEM